MPDYSMYEVFVSKIPRDFKFQNVESKLQTRRNYYEMGKIALALYGAKVYEDPATVHAVNQEYYIHPGITRYVLSRVCQDMPELECLIINRWNTDVRKDFPDAEIFDVSFNVGMFFKGDEFAFKPYKSTNKVEFDKQAIHDGKFCNSVGVGFDLMVDDVELCRFGGQPQRQRYQWQNVYQFIEDLINHFYYIHV